MRAQTSPVRADEVLVSRDAAKAIADRVLSYSTADDTRVNMTSEWSGNTRFANEQITTSGSIIDTTVRVTATVGKRRASATTNALDEASLRRAVDLAGRLARLSPENPELMPELGPQTYSPVNAFIEGTAALTPEARASAVKRTIDAGLARGKTIGNLFVAGFLSARAGATAVATNKGLFAYHRSTDADLSTTVRTPDGTGSGWARIGTRDWSAVDADDVGRTAADKAVISRNPQAIDPGEYTVVLEPQAVTDLVPLLAWFLDARNADEGRSAFSKKDGGTRIGEKIADERVTLYSDPADPDLLGRPFDEEGLPVGRRVWIENGVLKNLAYTRFWAQKQGVAPTGAMEADNDLLGGLKLSGGAKSTDDLIAGCERGVLVTHFFYIRSLDPRTLLFTGLTRDGTFLIEKGRVTRPLKNFRWNESPLLMLNRLEDIGRPEPTVSGVMMPALRVKNFNFTSLSEAV